MGQITGHRKWEGPRTHPQMGEMSQKTTRMGSQCKLRDPTCGTRAKWPGMAAGRQENNQEVAQWRIGIVSAPGKALSRPHW